MSSFFDRRRVEGIVTDIVQSEPPYSVYKITLVDLFDNRYLITLPAFMVRQLDDNDLTMADCIGERVSIICTVLHKKAECGAYIGYHPSGRCEFMDIKSTDVARYQNPKYSTDYTPTWVYNGNPAHGDVWIAARLNNMSRFDVKINGYVFEFTLNTCHMWTLVHNDTLEYWSIKTQCDIPRLFKFATFDHWCAFFKQSFLTAEVDNELTE